MASDNGTSGDQPKATKAVRRPRTAAQQRAEREAASSPEALAKDIEQTREDLAETLDAIAEKVSPKRVAKRTTKKAAASVRETAKDAAAHVRGTAADAKDSVRTAAASVRPAADEAAREALESAGQDGLTPVAAVEVPELGRPGAATAAAPLRTHPPVHTPPSPSGSLLRKEYVVAGAGLLGLALLLRRRGGKRRKRLSLRG